MLQSRLLLTEYDKYPSPVYVTEPKIVDFIEEKMVATTGLEPVTPAL